MLNIKDAKNPKNENAGSRPEILAPAGDIDSVYAALQNGANAVYLGQQVFSARQNAKNFDREGLSHAVSYCHTRGAKVYLTLNIIVFDYQWRELIDCIKTACDCAVDAIIVQDWGVAETVKRIAPTMPLHGSTQMSVHSRRGAALLKELGFSRVVLARELSREEISDITQNVDIETEVFVQGALCMSVSGQCYVSGMIGGRSGNRGNCAGTCRLPFTATRTPDHALSLKDLCLADKVSELTEMGVTSFKIEGRMKRPEYVAAASDLYRRALAGDDFSTDTIQSVFSRSGFTEGYYTNALPTERFGVRGYDDVTSATDSLLKSIRATYQKETGIIPIDCLLTVKKDTLSTLTMSDLDGNAVTVTGEPPQAAINRPLTEESAMANVFKLGGTPLVGNVFKADIEDGLMLPASAINALRRDATQLLLDKRGTLVPVECTVENDIKPSNENGNEKSSGRSKAALPNGVRIRFASMNQFAGFTDDALSTVAALSLPIGELERLSEGELESLAQYSKKLIIEPERYIASREAETLETLIRLKKLGFNRLLCNNAAHILLAREARIIPHGGFFLNATNSRAVASLKELGLCDVSLSFELKLQDALAIARENLLPTIAVVYGYLPLMLLRTCPIRKYTTCAECPNARIKDGRGTPATLTDRMGKKFPIICTKQRYSELLNCQPMWMLDRLGEVAPAGDPLLYFTYESPAQASSILNAYHAKDTPDGEFTRGLYYRSV